MEPLAFLPRLLACCATWGLIFAACPGVLLDEGIWPLAFVAIAPWTLAASRPGPRAWLAEYVASGLGCAALMWWIVFVFPAGVLAIFLIQGFYPALAGPLLRRVHGRIPLWLAGALVWTALETLRFALPCPPSLGWWRLGHQLGGVPALLAAAPLWGVAGMTFSIACVGGAVAQLARERRLGSTPLALAPLLVGTAVGHALPELETRPGPRLLLVQPGFTQQEKLERTAPFELFWRSLDITVAELERLEAAGEPPPDVVCWGETMLVDLYVVEPELHDAWADLEIPDWWIFPRSDVHLDVIDRAERDLLVGRLLPELPSGTRFLSGVLVYAPGETWAERRNGIAIWEPDGTRAPTIGKTRLVPGPETMVGLERFAAVRDFVLSIAPYIPDLAAYPEPGVLDLESRAGVVYRVGGTVCFDNAFLTPYTEPVRAGPLDFHLVVSNEAWYRDSCEMDQMVAFSRCAAAASGRSLVRATNNGVTALFGPDGRELGRLRVDGEDRHVAGSLLAQVPVPLDEAGRTSRTPFARTSGIQHGLWMALPVLALLRRRRGNPLRPAG